MNCVQLKKHKRRHTKSSVGKPIPIFQLLNKHEISNGYNSLSVVIAWVKQYDFLILLRYLKVHSGRWVYGSSYFLTFSLTDLLMADLRGILIWTLLSVFCKTWPTTLCVGSHDDDAASFIADRAAFASAWMQSAGWVWTPNSLVTSSPSVVTFPWQRNFTVYRHFQVILPAKLFFLKMYSNPLYARTLPPLSVLLKCKGILQSQDDDEITKRMENLLSRLAATHWSEIMPHAIIRWRRQNTKKNIV